MIRLGGWGLIFVGLAEIFDMALGNHLSKMLMMLMVDDVKKLDVDSFCGLGFV